MDDLTQATGADRAKMSLPGMTRHHQGTPAEARDELRIGTTPRLESLLWT